MTESAIFPTHDPAYQAVYAEESAMVDASELIAHALDVAGISSADLARALNVSRSEISARLSGERNLTIRKLAATLHALDHQLVLASKPRRAAGATYQVLASTTAQAKNSNTSGWKPLAETTALTAT